MSSFTNMPFANSPEVLKRRAMMNNAAGQLMTKNAAGPTPLTKPGAFASPGSAAPPPPPAGGAATPPPPQGGFVGGSAQRAPGVVPTQQAPAVPQLSATQAAGQATGASGAGFGMQDKLYNAGGLVVGSTSPYGKQADTGWERVAQLGSQGVQQVDENALANNAQAAQQSSDEAKWAEIMKMHDAALANELKAAGIKGAETTRRASEMGALMGGQAGGGSWQSGMAQAGLTGQQLMMDAQRQHDVRGLEMQMTWLKMQLEKAEAEKNRDLQRSLQEQIQNTQLAITQANITANREGNADQKTIREDEAIAQGMANRVDENSIPKDPPVGWSKEAWEKFRNDWYQKNPIGSVIYKEQE